jgi:hypothetical protein
MVVENDASGESARRVPKVKQTFAWHMAMGTDARRLTVARER